MFIKVTKISFAQIRNCILMSGYQRGSNVKSSTNIMGMHTIESVNIESYVRVLLDMLYFSVEAQNYKNTAVSGRIDLPTTGGYLTQ